jgi:hypothetical protein
LEWDAEEQQVPRSSPTPAVSELDQLLVGRGQNENWSLDNMPTKLIQRNEASTTTFKDDALEVAVILHWMKRACVYFLKV